METRFKGFPSMKQDVNLEGDWFEDTWMEILKELKGAIDQRGDRWEESRKNSIQWEFETRRALSLMLDIADGLGICDFLSVLEESSASKSLVHSIVAAEVEQELRNWYARTLAGNLCVIATSSCAPPGMLNDLRVLLSSAENQLKAVKAYN